MNYTKGNWKITKTTTLEGKGIYAVCTYPEPTRIQRVADVFVEANANLIAAAPAMHEALKAIIAKRMECHETEAASIPSEIQSAYKALAKAKGGG